MEKGSVSFPINNSIRPSLHSPKILFPLKDLIKLLRELVLEVQKKWARTISNSSLDTQDTSKGTSLISKNIHKSLLVPSFNFDSKVINSPGRLKSISSQASLTTLGKSISSQASFPKPSFNRLRSDLKAVKIPIEKWSKGCQNFD